jgi:NAD+-dependent secondary alcohol dehydrogenase Adh1
VKAALMRAYHEPLELVELPVPEISRPTDVLVRVGGAGVCATDLHAIDGLMEAAGVTLPLVLGHENAGWVEEVADGVTTVSPGDAVLVYPPYSCGLCVACRRGDDLHCIRHQFTGLTVDGGFADYVLVAERSLLAGVEPVDVAPHADAGLTAYHAVRRLAHLAVPGSTAAVIGIGGVGHLALQLVRELGSSTVIAVDSDERRRRLADELGADEVVDGAGAVDAVRDLTGGRGADLVFDFVGTQETHDAAAAMLARGGTFSVIGYGGTVAVPSIALVANEQSVVGNLVGTWVDLWELLQLHATGRLVLRTEVHRLDSVNDVLEKLRAGEVDVRAVLVPG